MKYIATEGAITKLNTYELTEYDVTREFKSRIEVEKTGDMTKAFINWKNEDLIILPLSKKTALIYEYGKEIKGSYEDLPEIKFDGIWKKKKIS